MEKDGKERRLKLVASGLCFYSRLKPDHRISSVMTVLITATGLRGKKPLIDRINVIKGSRQNKYVTLGKMLAPKSALRGLLGRGGSAHSCPYSLGLNPEDCACLLWDAGPVFLS